VFDDEKTLNALGRFLEQLRYAGLVTVHKVDTKTEQDRLVFDCFPPKGVSDTMMWADQNAQRFRSFGYFAEAAPEWKLGDRPIETE